MNLVHEVSQQLRKILAKLAPELLVTAEGAANEVLYVPIGDVPNPPMSARDPGILGAELPLLYILHRVAPGLVKGSTPHEARFPTNWSSPTSPLESQKDAPLAGSGSSGISPPGVSESHAPGAANPAIPATDPAPPPRPLEHVEFTVYHPRQIQPSRWYTLLAFAHLGELPPDAPPDRPDPEVEVRRRAEQVLGPQARNYKQKTNSGTQPIAREETLTFVPRGDGLAFNPPSQSFLWIEDVQQADFRMQAVSGSAEGPLRGSVSVYLGIILLAEVGFTVRVSQSEVSPTELTTAPAQASSRPYRKIFASYSHQDLWIVAQFEKYAKALGDRYLRDWNDLRAGEEWSPRLRDLIDEADVFQLFWSSASSRSAFVEQEWRYALDKRKGSFIRPGYWEDPFPPPPTELSPLHFERLPAEFAPPALPGSTERPVPLKFDDGTGGQAAASPEQPSLQPPRTTKEPSEFVPRSAPERAQAQKGGVATLSVVSRGRAEQLIELHDRTVVGRHPSCQIVIDSAAVSRNHAQIIEGLGAFYIEDLRSRNGTLVNGVRISGRRQLQENDEIRIGDMTFRFRSKRGDDFEASSAVMLATEEHADDLPRGQSVPVAEESPHDTPQRSVDTHRPVDLSEELPQILDRLFDLFPQAERGVVLLKDPDSDNFQVQSMKSRRDDPTDTPRLSRTIIKQAVTSGRAVISPDDLNRLDVAESLHEINSFICAPLVGQDGVSLGVIQIDTHDWKHQFSRDDLEVLAGVAAQAALAVENARLHDALIRKQNLEHERQIACQVQIDFVPTTRPSIENYEIHDLHEASRGVDGNFLDYIPLPDGRLAMYVGCVAAKGASLLRQFNRFMTSELISESTLSGAMVRTNAHIGRIGLAQRFVTCVAAVLDPSAHTVTVVNAGHLPPVRRSANGQVDALPEENMGLPLGIMPDARYEECIIELGPGDLLLMFTDGVTGTMNPTNEMYGNSRLHSVVQHRSAGVAPLIEALIQDIDFFCQGARRDDVSLIGFRRLA